MRKPQLFFVLCCFIFLAAFACGCGSGNIFSWAHNSGSGNYEDLMSDADSSMSKKDFAKAAQYYEKALDKQPYSNDAMKGYASALFNDAISDKIGDIINSVLQADSASAESVFDIFQDRNVAEKLHEATDKMIDKGIYQNAIASNDAELLLDSALAQLFDIILDIFDTEAGRMVDMNLVDGDYEFSVSGPLSQQAKDELKNVLEDLLSPQNDALDNLSSTIGALAAKLNAEGSNDFVNEMQKQINSLKGNSGAIKNLLDLVDSL
ncbi:MAG: hypothetical protein LBQ47_09255 [Endomicrobium sp.]|jgi:tetratricopeptide (TPR) repeat protein|nr:hypothetical protein [Endomicrobium sp.]